MDQARAASELSELRTRIAALEASIANVHEGQSLQQQGMEGLQAALVARIHALEATSGSRTLETLLGLALEGLRRAEPLEARPAGRADTPEYRSIWSNRRVLDALEWQTARRLKTHDDAGVLQVARAAGDWACMHHPGALASASIERALQLTGQRLLGGLEPWTPAGGRRRVLHVMTIAHPIGGHTRLAERWMRLDADSEHAVALTEQGDLAPPEALERTAGGRIHRLAHETPAGRVEELARVARAFDVVVLHIHPYDAVAVAAFGDSERRPPTILVDHGDHLFWLGVGAADTVVSVRPSGAALVTGRRGIRADRNVVIPLPLDPVTRGRTRAAARDELGFPSDALVLLTVASAHKYADVGAQSFTSLVGQVMQAHDRAVLLAIGPDLAASDWAELARRFPGRVRAEGPSIETELAREAADVYLDSFPFGSPTSLFESALYETPTVVLRPEGVGVLAVEDPDVELIVVPDGPSWVEAVARLLRDDELRERAGRQTGREMLAAHSAERIGPLIANALATVRRGSASELARIISLVAEFDAALVAWQDASGLGRRPEDLLAAHGLLPILA
jgi:hypothetical protein